MTKIKIVSNPYNRSLSYFINKEQTDTWENIEQDSINSRLRERDEDKIFLSFKAKEIIDTIIAEYYVGTESVEIVFEGTSDEYEELENICNDEEIREQIHLVRSTKILRNARDILRDTKDIFETVQPVIKNIVKDNPQITKGLIKVSDALKDIIPICIFGNYSAGKSTFINALIGYEILPSGGDPVTSKIYEIHRSKQTDRAYVTFTYRGEEFKLLFSNKEFQIITGNKEKDIIQEIFAVLDKEEDINIILMVNKTIEVLNFFEKRDKTTVLISNVVEIEVPFSENGKLGQSLNEFVIFDTPGSNSQTNMDHEQVLMESLEGFSNGIPVWVTQYDSIDSVDNANLCGKLLQIEALDKRFTMIVVNKADSVELPKNGLSDDDISDIMEYESVEKMYSSGIYFVSSVMGLGAKTPDGIISEYLADVFDEKERKFSDPSARSYKQLYEYNIMPRQMKVRAKEYSKRCENLIYANSGIYCVEMEMERFATRYAAYNKCQMVYMFLKNIIDETGRRIEEKTALLEKSKKQREQDLDEKMKDLVGKIQSETQNAVKQYEKDSKTRVSSYAKEELVYKYTTEELESLNQDFTNQNSQKVNLGSYEKDFEGAKNSRWKNITENSQNLFKGNFVESIKELATEWASDSKTMQQKRENVDSLKQEIDREVSDQLLRIVVDEFKKNSTDAQNKLSFKAKKLWQSNAQEYRDKMIELITGSDVLSVQRRTELSDVILNYRPLQFDDDADRIFIKAKFLRGNVLGIRLGTSEKLNTRLLVYRYNSILRNNIDKMAEMINGSCFTDFKSWQENLQAVIEENLTIYNPELCEITELIKEESERINELQTNQHTISNSFSTIEGMMAWEELD